MYSDVFCKVYNQFGWNYFPEAFGEQLLEWMKHNRISIKDCLDLGCGTGVLCEILYRNGIKSTGMDLSENMIAIARERNPEICYEVANMVTYRPQRQFDLVTSTGDALNHIIALDDVKQIFRNVYECLRAGGFFIFDLLDESEISTDEAIDLDFSDNIKAQFQMLRDVDGMVTLKTTVYENGTQQFEERIMETVHDRKVICDMLQECGFEVLQCSHQLLENIDSNALTWFVVARK
ncbi:MAG: class I SAM-dependent methyltransferase [Oscillospiraceae bacterium]|nr:class I SAM-dependent methyltransferase [Oscillospiraceae bacterium]